LQIKCLPELNNLVGFIGNEKNIYTINFDKKRITIGNKSIDFSNKFKEEFGFKYIEASILLEAFGLKITFNPRSLSAKLEYKFELPLIKKLRLEKMRDNISKLQQKPLIVDTIIPRNYHLFKFGTLDWQINSNQNTEGNTNSIGLSAGAELLFGETQFTVNYNPQKKINLKDISVGWRWVNNESEFISQARIGQVSAPSSSISGTKIIGLTLNNSSNRVRKTGGSFTITETTEPNWNVELYINDILIDYVVADAYGLFIFKVPIIYGYNTLKLKFYGPLGEERTEERVLNIPYTLAAAKTLTYSLTAGILQDTYKDYYSKVAFNYGVTRALTVSGGVEYLSNSPKETFLPYTAITFQPMSSSILNFSYTHNKNLAGLLNVNITKTAFLTIGYTKDMAEESLSLGRLNVGFSAPFSTKYFSGFTRLNWSRSIYKLFNYDQLNLSTTGYYKRLRINSSSSINWTSSNTPQINSVLGISTRLTNGLSVISQGSYNITTNKLIDAVASLQVKISKINLSASYQRQIEFKTNNYTLNLNYMLPFSRFSFSSTYDDKNLNLSEAAAGSMTLSTNSGIIHAGNNSAMGKGGLLLYPFLDLNGNSKLDEGEKKVFLPSVKVTGAKAVISKKDSIVRVFDLNAFVNYTVKFSDTQLNNIAWRFKHKTYKILVDPNQYKRVFIPVISVGEISGIVSLRKDENIQGQGRVLIQIFDEKGTKITETLSEFDGYYSYLGLKPGKYTVRVDETQLKNLNYKALPKVHQITIKVSEYGDIIDDLDFTLSKKAPKKPKE
tara:strand:+ start:1821 stop:4169 length:2349 start_codon:yes stop_codon:yes gene_type:complete